MKDSLLKNVKSCTFKKSCDEFYATGIDFFPPTEFIFYHMQFLSCLLSAVVYSRVSGSQPQGTFALQMFGNVWRYFGLSLTQKRG